MTSGQISLTLLLAAALYLGDQVYSILFARDNAANFMPAAARWVREGSLFVIVSNAITVLKCLLLQFLPAAFAGQRRLWLAGHPADAVWRDLPVEHSGL